MDEISEARKILGKEAEGLTDEQIKNLLAFVDYMCEGWLDKFEISTFGKTIQHLTNGVNKNYHE
jgi:hypothetical protein